MAAFCWTDLQATPAYILAWVVRRRSVEVTFTEVQPPRGVQTPRPWSDHASAHPLVLLALFAIVTLLALPRTQDGPIPVQTTAWYHTAEPPVADCWALVRRHLWCARYVVPAAAEADGVHWPREALDRLLTGVPMAA